MASLVLIIYKRQYLAYLPNRPSLYTRYRSCVVSPMSQQQTNVLGSVPPYAGLPPVNVALFEAKARMGLTFAQIANQLGKDEVWIAAAFYGQAKFTEQEIRQLSDLFGSNLIGVVLADIGSQWWPTRGLGPMPPQDPVIYRLYEGVLVYGHAIKAIIHEKFGDGIMSLIDCKVKVDKKPDPKGDRVVLTFDGKFLPYATW